jgi:hypothetical protein
MRTCAGVEGRALHRPEARAAVAEQHRDARRLEIGEGEVQVSVSVETGDLDIARL